MNKKIIISVLGVVIFFSGLGSGMIIERKYNKNESVTVNTPATSNITKTGSSKYVGIWVNKDKDEVTITKDSDDTFTIKNNCNSDVVVGTYKDGIIVGELVGRKFVYKIDEKGILTIDGPENAGQYMIKEN